MIMTPKEYYDEQKAEQDGKEITRCDECSKNLGTQEEIKKRTGNGAITRIVKDDKIYCWDCWKLIKQQTRLFRQMKQAVDEFESEPVTFTIKKKRKKRRK